MVFLHLEAQDKLEVLIIMDKVAVAVELQVVQVEVVAVAVEH